MDNGSTSSGKTTIKASTSSGQTMDIDSDAFKLWVENSIKDVKPFPAIMSITVTMENGKEEIIYGPQDAMIQVMNDLWSKLKKSPMPNSLAFIICGYANAQLEVHRMFMTTFEKVLSIKSTLHLVQTNLI